MTSPFSSDGTVDIRQYIQNNWNYVGLRDDTGTIITRIDVANDTRASWSSGPQSDPLEATIEVDRVDSDIDGFNPTGTVTIADTISLKSDTDTTPRSVDSVVDVVLEAEDDSVIITHQVYF